MFNMKCFHQKFTVWMPFLLPQSFSCSGIRINLHVPFHSGRSFTRIPIPLPTFHTSYTLLFQSFPFTDRFLVWTLFEKWGFPTQVIKQHIPSLEIWHNPVTLPGHNLELGPGYVFLVPEGRTSPNQWGAPHLYGPQLFLPEDPLLPTKGERGNGSYVSTIAFSFWVFGPFFSFGILEIHPCLREQNMRNEIVLHINVEYIFIYTYLFVYKKYEESCLVTMAAKVFLQKNNIAILI